MKPRPRYVVYVGIISFEVLDTDATPAHEVARCRTLVDAKEMARLLNQEQEIREAVDAERPR